jgi:hypothetical protein
MEIVTVCKSCDGTGFMNRETEWKQYCLDCVTGNTLALQACGSNLDPAKYPACHYDIDSPGCNDQGLFPDGTSCDCDRLSILGFESYGCSHEVAITVMCVLDSTDYGYPDHIPHSQFEQLHAIIGGPLGPVPDNATITAQLTAWCASNPEAVYYGLGNNWLARFL